MQNQVAWLTAIVNGAGTRKLILFSHHQPFSQLDDQGPKLQVALANLLKQRTDSRLVLGPRTPTGDLRSAQLWGFKGRCIGNGGFPQFRDDLPNVGGDVYKLLQLDAQPFAPQALLLDGPNFWIPQAQETFSPHGYVFLQFDGDTVSEIYRAPNNVSYLKTQI